MRILGQAPRLILHAGLAGLYGGVAVALLVVLMNPAPAGTPWVPVATAVAVLYALAAGVIWPLVYGAIRFFASHTLRVPRLSMRYLMAFQAVNMAVVLASGWVATSRYRRVLAPGEAERLDWFCLALSVAWLIGAVVSLAPALRRIRAAQIAAAALAVLVLAIEILPPRESAGVPEPMARSARPKFPIPSRRLLLLNIDGADLDLILTLQAQGKLPAFRRLKDEGAYGRLRSLTPCEASVTRTTLATGRSPFHHGVRSGTVRAAGARGPRIQLVPPGLGFDALLKPILTAQATSISDRGGPALWEIAAKGGGAGGEAGFEIDLDQGGEVDPALTEGRRRGLVAEFLNPEAWRRAKGGTGLPLTILAQASAADDEVSVSFARLAADPRPGITAVSFPGLDLVAHTFLRFARPEEFGNVTGGEVDLYGEVLERYYRRIDGLVSRAMDAAGDSGWVVVTSSHGMSPVPLRQRLLAFGTGDDRRSGTHEGGPDGFLFARGPGVRPGPLPVKGTIVDVVPTVLYALRFPVARDLDGAILTGLFAPGYTLAHPVVVIGSYD